MFTNSFYPENTMPGMVAGIWWNARMNNGAVFSLWTPSRESTRKAARTAILEYAEAYEPTDIENMWTSKTPAPE